MLVPRIGYCEPNCVLCSQVCPTGAIWEITVAEKTGTRDSGSGLGNAESVPASAGAALGRAIRRHPAAPAATDPIRIGTAFYDRGRCLPWAMATECIVCEEWCPTSPKAIYLVSAEVVDRNGETKTVKQPYVDPKRCTGCGACEYACPIKGSPADLRDQRGRNPLAHEPVPAPGKPAPPEVDMKKRQRISRCRRPPTSPAANS